MTGAHSRSNGGVMAAEPQSATATMIFIASAGHSGSTLLDLMLGSHSQMSSAGEMNRLSLHADDRVCACGQTVTSCGYWNQVRSAIAATRQRGALRWDECHTDLPPQKPLLRLDGVDVVALREGAMLPRPLRKRMVSAGLDVSEMARVVRSGVRDRKWRIVDPAAKSSYVIRIGESGLQVYGLTVKWKNPLRMIPEPLEVALAMESRRGVDLLKACSSHVRDYWGIASNSWDVADSMATVGHTPYVVDSSKSPVRLKLLYMARPDRVRILHLVRDGRAVANSAMRRQDTTAERAARVWKRDNQNVSLMLRTIPERLTYHVRYESLCDDPEGELRRIAAFLGVGFEPAMLTPWGRPVHNIPGNPMLFDRSRKTISKDERWRRDLSERDLQAFERIAGRLNRSFGYK